MLETKNKCTLTDVGSHQIRGRPIALLLAARVCCQSQWWSYKAYCHNDASSSSTNAMSSSLCVLCSWHAAVDSLLVCLNSWRIMSPQLYYYYKYFCCGVVVVGQLTARAAHSRVFETSAVRRRGEDEDGGGGSVVSMVVIDRTDKRNCSVHGKLLPPKPCCFLLPVRFTEAHKNR